MLRKFKISIDGTQYLVEMEEVGAPVPTPADLAAPAPALAPSLGLGEGWSAVRMSSGKTKGRPG